MNVSFTKFIKLEGERTQRHLGLCGLSPPSYSTRLITVSAVENHPTFMGWFQRWVTNKLILESLELKLNTDYDMWKKVTQIEKKAESTAVHSDCWIFSLHGRKNNLKFKCESWKFGNSDMICTIDRSYWI